MQIVQKFRNSYDSAVKKISNFRYKNLLYVSVFLVVIIYFWRSIISLFKPANDAKQQETDVTKQNAVYKNNGSITADGRFITGTGFVTKYTVSQARENAERLAAIMNTYKGAKWYAITFSLFGFGAVSSIKSVCNPNYPASYRRYVAAAYRDVYTNYRSLQSDVYDYCTGFGGTSYYDENLRKYFIF